MSIRIPVTYVCCSLTCIFNSSQSTCKVCTQLGAFVYEHDSMRTTQYSIKEHVAACI